MTDQASPNLDVTAQTDKKLSYQFLYHLKHEYIATTSVTCVAFSPDGSYVACGADDGTMSIWSNSPPGTLLHVLSGKFPVLCITWLDGDHILGGLANGVLACVEIDKVPPNPLLLLSRPHTELSLAG